MGRMRKCCRLRAGGRGKEGGERLREEYGLLAVMIVDAGVLYLARACRNDSRIRFSSLDTQQGECKFFEKSGFIFCSSLSRHGATILVRITLGNDSHTSVGEIAVLVS